MNRIEFIEEIERHRRLNLFIVEHVQLEEKNNLIQHVEEHGELIRQRVGQNATVKLFEIYGEKFNVIYSLYTNELVIRGVK